MPFTFAHGVAALPFRRLRLVPSALLIGTFAPDFEYFLRLSPHDRFGHTLLGTFALTLPLALLVLWLFHTYVKSTVVRLLPDVIQRRLTNHLGRFYFGGVARFALIVGSILLGMATHLAWDSFTHANTWPYRHWSMLGPLVHVPIVGQVPVYKMLQHGSTCVGIVILSIWLIEWYRASEPSSEILASAASSTKKILISSVVATAAIVGALIWAALGIGIPTDATSGKRFIGVVVVTAIAIAWWELVAYGVLYARIIVPKLDRASIRT